MWRTHSSSSHPAKLEKLSPSNGRHEASNPVPCGCPLRCSPSRRPPAPLPGAGQGNLQSPRAGCFPSCLSSPTIPKKPKRLWQHSRSQLEEKCRRSLEMCNGGKRDLAVRRAAVRTCFGAARSHPKSSPPCPGWEKHPPLEGHGETAPLQHGTARGGERGPRCWAWRCRTFHPSTCGPSTRTCGAPTATMGGACKRGPAPLVLPQLYYGGLSVGLIDIEPECAVRRLSVNYMWLSIYCFERDLGLKHMNLLLVKTSSITFSWHQ